MEMKCNKCGASVSEDQAFCSKCGAVIGMDDSRQKSEGWNMAATMVGKKMPAPEANRPTAVRPSPPSEPARTPPPQQQPQRVYTPQPQPPAPRPAPARSSNAMLFVIIGFIAVLLIGGLLALLVYLSWQ
jgi:hypothetical protein